MILAMLDWPHLRKDLLRAVEFLVDFGPHPKVTC